jgi:phage gp29-like protein
MRKRQVTSKWAPNAPVVDTPKKHLDPSALEVNIAAGNHFATRTRLNDFVRLMRTLPNDDPVLKKMGKGIPALRELLIDSHLESVWTVRCSTTAGAEWFVGAGAEGVKEKAAAEAFGAELKNLDRPRIIEEMMEAMAYGYSPIEIIWEAREGKWGIGNLVGKNPEWFEFDQENRLVFHTGITYQEALPENRFLVVQHHASYANPYGSKVFSKCFWPVTFKRKGLQWWTVYVEKYGGAFVHGQYSANADDQCKGDLLDALERMISDAVAITPEGSEITIVSASDKGGSTSVHSEYIKMVNAEISKAVLGQTLTTEIGDKGSYAAAKAHNLVREDLAKADRSRISAAFNRLSSVYTVYNFGAEVVPPKFEFVQDEDLQIERAKRDTELYSTGWRPRKRYLTREYGIPEEDFDLTVAENTGKPAGFTMKNHKACSCGKRDRGMVSRIAALFTSKEEQDQRLMQEFAEQMEEEGQAALDATVQSYVDALGTVDTFDEARQALQRAYKRRSLTPLVQLIDTIRYAAAGIGHHRKRRTHG